MHIYHYIYIHFDHPDGSAPKFVEHTPGSHRLPTIRCAGAPRLFDKGQKAHKHGQMDSRRDCTPRLSSVNRISLKWENLSPGSDCPSSTNKSPIAFCGKKLKLHRLMRASDLSKSKQLCLDLSLYPIR